MKRAKKFKKTTCHLILILSILVFPIFMVFTSPYCALKGEGPYKQKNAETDESKTFTLLFLKSLSEKPARKIKYLKVNYDIRFQREWKVNLRMSGYVEMKRAGDSFISTFHISKPVGADLWGKFAMLVYGKHTEEYKKAVEEMESTVIEHFLWEKGKFFTDSVIEILPEKKRLEGHNGFKIVFDRKKRRVNFWEDRSHKEKSASIKYDNQQGPLTAFFNYVLFEEPETEFVGINIQRQNLNNKTKEKKGSKPIVSQKIRVGRNNSGLHREYPYAVFLMRDNFFDIVYGKYIYYNITMLRGTTLKIPDSVLVKGIINKSKFRERAKRIKNLKKRKLSSSAFKKRLKAINSMDILSAENVRVFFASAEILF
jgi:hypothetical protein